MILGKPIMLWLRHKNTIDIKIFQNILMEVMTDVKML